MDRLIVGGDWNATLQCIDKKGGARWQPTAYRDKLISMTEDLDLSDIFRKKKPSKLSFTYESKFLKVKSRIDFFLISNSLSESVSDVGTKTSIASDHKAIQLRLQFINFVRGPGLWKFNNSLLEDDEFIELVNENYPAIINKYQEIRDKRLLWELIKMEIRSLTIPYSKNKARQNRTAEFNILKRLILSNASHKNDSKLHCSAAMALSHIEYL